MFTKLKESFKKHKTSVTALSTALFCSVVTSVSAFADAGGDIETLDLVSPMTKGMNQAAKQTISCFSAIIPIGLTIFACRFAWIKGVQFFSSIAKK